MEIAVDSLARSVQIISPPVHLQTRTSWGSQGQGSYRVGARSFQYEERLLAGEPGPITRIHDDWATTPAGTFRRHAEIRVPAAHQYERWVLHQCPTGAYYYTSATTGTTRSMTMTIRERLGPEADSGAAMNGVCWSALVHRFESWESFQHDTAVSQASLGRPVGGPGFFNVLYQRGVYAPWRYLHRTPVLGMPPGYQPLPAYRPASSKRR